MTFMLEVRTPVYSVKHGDTVVWRKVRAPKGVSPLQWGTEREARAFADLFYSTVDNRDDLRIVEVFDAPSD